jgi:hypothetical protein
MKYVLKFLKSILLAVWIIVAVFTTICLISYNKYNVSVFGNQSFIIVDNNDLQPTFVENDLAIVQKNSPSDYKVGDSVFFYLNNKKTDKFVNYGAITNIQTDDTAETAYFVGDTKISYSELIGKGDGSIIYHKAGLVLSILESRWGYMFLVILPTLFALVYEIYAIVMEVKAEAKGEKTEEE